MFFRKQLRVSFFLPLHIKRIENVTKGLENCACVYVCKCVCVTWERKRERDREVNGKRDRCFIDVRVSSHLPILQLTLSKKFNPFERDILTHFGFNSFCTYSDPLLLSFSLTPSLSLSHWVWALFSFTSSQKSRKCEFVEAEDFSERQSLKSCLSFVASEAQLQKNGIIVCRECRLN